jgi:SagB-type dehydrogenase family enzyme
VRLQWCDGVSASVTKDEALIVEGPTSRVTLRPDALTTRDALLRFAPPGEDEELLADLAADGNGGLSLWYYYLGCLARRGLVRYSLHADGKHLATLSPVSSAFVASSLRAVAAGRYVLSRFAYMHRCGASAVLESPLSHARVLLENGRAAALLAELAAPVTIKELANRMEFLSIDAVAGLLGLLLRAGMILHVRDDGSVTEHDDPCLQTWEFHDLLFHARSRKGRTDAACGATFRFAARLAPPPALKELPHGKVFELYRPEMARLIREDPPLAFVQERRRSARTFNGDQLITSDQLGEFLFRVARVRDIRSVEIATPIGLMRCDMVSRPYPSGGSIYEQEFYVAVKNCGGLASGLYYYEGRNHHLIRLRAKHQDVTALLDDATQSAGTPADEAQVLIILAARFPRLAWKYESISYALVVKHVGVIHETMYMAATAMGLACCAIGGGDSDIFARAAGTQYFAETSVGEFLLGSAKNDALSSCD